jgi:hypothetical protein
MGPQDSGRWADSFGAHSLSGSPMEIVLALQTFAVSDEVAADTVGCTTNGCTTNQCNTYSGTTNGCTTNQCSCGPRTSGTECYYTMDFCTMDCIGVE